MSELAGKFNAMRIGKYSRGDAEFPKNVYPIIDGISTQFVYEKGCDHGRLISEHGEVGCASHIVEQLEHVAVAIINEDNAPHFEEVDWKSGVMIEGVISSTSAAALEEALEDLDGEFGDVSALHFIATVAVPYKFWVSGKDRYDMGNRRLTLLRAMGKVGLLNPENKTACWLLPRYQAPTEYRMMDTCYRLHLGAPAGLITETSFRQIPSFPVLNGMIYDFCMPWGGSRTFYQSPTIRQIEDELL